MERNKQMLSNPVMQVWKWSGCKRLDTCSLTGTQLALTKRKGICSSTWVACSSLLNPNNSSEKKQMENFQTVTFSRYMKHQVKGHLLDPSNFSTKTGKKTPSTVTEMWEDRNNNNKSSTCERASKLLWKAEDWKLMLCVRILRDKSPWSTMYIDFYL